MSRFRHLLPAFLLIAFAFGQLSALHLGHRTMMEWIADVESVDDSGNRGEKAQDEENHFMEAVTSSGLTALNPSLITKSSFPPYIAAYSSLSTVPVYSPPEIG